MSARYWLVKQEPESYSWATFVQEGRTDWTGVRNFQARNNLRAMAAGDRVLFYASGELKSVLGIARVSKPAFPDPTADEGDWVAVELEAEIPLARPVALREIKADPTLRAMALVRNSRLSVMPVQKAEFSRIVDRAQG
jgi:predicted RNA-binding protein with PUA-like domain